MQRSEEIDISKLADILSSVFQEPAIAYEAYSAFDAELKKYENKETLLAAIYEAVENKSHSASYSIYYPVAQGYFFADRKSVNSEKCNGAKFRYVASGWGLVQLQIDLAKKPTISVRISVNTLKRAEAWSVIYPEFKEPALWDWVFIEKQARRIIRVLRKCA